MASARAPPPPPRDDSARAKGIPGFEMAYCNLCLYNASGVPEFHKLSLLPPFIIPKGSTPGQQNRDIPLVKSMFLQPSKSPQATISIAREIQRQEKEKRSLESLPPRAHKLGPSFCHLGTVRTLLQNQPMSRLFMFWFLFFRPAVKQKWYLCLGGQVCPPESTPLRNRVKGYRTEKQALIGCCPQC